MPGGSAVLWVTSMIAGSSLVIPHRAGVRGLPPSRQKEGAKMGHGRGVLNKDSKSASRCDEASQQVSAEIQFSGRSKAGKSLAAGVRGFPTSRQKEGAKMGHGRGV